MTEPRKIRRLELEENNHENSMWVVINGKVYDFTSFYQGHPGGQEAVEEWGGKDGTTAFDAAGHPKWAVEQLKDYYIGDFEKSRMFTKVHEISEHSAPDDLWLLISNKVYDVSNFKHPGGKEILVQNAGQDATTQFEDINHSKKAYNMMKDFYIGDFYNPEDEKESWESYIKRKQREEENQMSPLVKSLLIALFIVSFSYLYNQLAGQQVGAEA